MAAAHHKHVVMGTWVTAEIQAAPQRPPLRVSGTEHHASHPGLHKGAGAHRAGFEGHQQGAIVEAPVGAQPRRLLQGHKFGMSERLLIPFASVAAPADRPTLPIQHHRRHRDLPFGSHRFGAAQQPLHPGIAVEVHPRAWAASCSLPARLRVPAGRAGEWGALLRGFGASSRA